MQSTNWCETAERRLEVRYTSENHQVHLDNTTESEDEWAKRLERWFELFPPVDLDKNSGELAAWRYGPSVAWSLELEPGATVHGAEASAIEAAQAVRRFLVDHPSETPVTARTVTVWTGDTVHAAKSVSGSLAELDALPARLEAAQPGFVDSD